MAHPIDNPDSPRRSGRTDRALIDFAIIEDLAQNTDDDLVRELIELFFEQGVEQIGRMKNGFETWQLETIRQAAHTMKTSSAIVGAMGVAERCAEVEKQIRLGKTRGLARRVMGVERSYRRSCQLMKASRWCSEAG